jgi:hypothetical protein
MLLRASSPATFTTSVSVNTVIFSFFLVFSATDSAQEKSLPLTKTVTWFAYFVKNTASSAAAKPPPTTKTSFDSKAFKEAHPELYVKYVKTSNVSGSLRVTKREKKSTDNTVEADFKDLDF